jgi:hypothetical protein
MTEHEPTRTKRLADRISELIESADELCRGEEHRREPLIERAERQGLSRATAERAYDLALEESIPPACGIAVTVTGISVQPLESPAADVQAVEASEPEWVDQPPPAREAEVERRLRQTFRRVRSFLADSDSPRSAFAALAKEPDLEPYDY